MNMINFIIIVERLRRIEKNFSASQVSNLRNLDFVNLFKIEPMSAHLKVSLPLNWARILPLQVALALGNLKLNTFA